MVDFAEQLRARTAADQEPRLSAEDIDLLLDQFKTTDAAGLPPTDPLWTPTYNLRAAARAGWKLKSGRAAELINSDLDGDRLEAQQIFEHCQRMVVEFSGNAAPVMGPPAAA